MPRYDVTEQCYLWLHRNSWILSELILLFTKKETEAEKSGTAEAEKEAEKAKPKKKSKISEDITVELVIKDILDPTAVDLASSKKK